MNPDVGNYDTTEINIEHLNEFYRNQVPDSLSVSEIHRAVLEGDIYKVKQWIESGGCVNEISKGYSALHLAVMKNDLQILEYLLTRDNIQVDCTCYKGNTPLSLAVTLGHIELVKRLLQARSDINIPNIYNCLPLHVSVNHPDICYLLIQYGASIDVVDDDGRTPLHYAAERDCIETIHMLLYHNADANAVDTFLETPFMRAIDYGKVDAQKVLLEYVDDFNRVYRCYTEPGSILIRALQRNSLFVKDIIDRGADVNYSKPGHDISVFSLCLDIPVDLATFKLVWERLCYSKSRKTINLIYLLLFPNVVPTFLNVIIESDNFEPAVQYFSYTKEDRYFEFLYLFFKGKFALDQLTALTCRLLQYGFCVSNRHIHMIFSYYGYCELFKILLYMDNYVPYGWQPDMALSRLILDVHYKLDQLVVEDLFSFSKKNLLQLFEYSLCPHLITLTAALTFRYCHNESLHVILQRLPKVPSLIQLARDAARIQIWQSLKIANTCQFYTAVDHLDISCVYKDILTFKRKIYKVE